MTCIVGKFQLVRYYVRYFGYCKKVSGNKATNLGLDERMNLSDMTATQIYIDTAFAFICIVLKGGSSFIVMYPEVKVLEKGTTYHPSVARYILQVCNFHS